MKEKWNILLKRQMKNAGITIVKLAERMGLGKSTIGHWLTGERNPTLEEIAKMFYFVGIEKVEFFNDGLMSLEETKMPEKIQGIEVIGGLTFRSVDQVPLSPLRENIESRFIDARSNDPSAYAIVVNGALLEPRIISGEYLVIEPFAKIQTYDEVLIKLRNGDYMIKVFTLERNGEYRFLDPNKMLNSAETVLLKDEIESIHYIGAIVKPQRVIK